MTPRLQLFASVLLLLISQLTFAADWPQWRGPDGQGHSQATNLPQSWSETEHITWKTDIPGRGWSSPVIGNGQIWLTTAEIDESNPEERKLRLKTIANSQPVTIADHVDLRAVCLDQETGRMLHNVILIGEDHPDAIHTQNSYATPTPLLHDGRLFCHFGTHGTACIDTSTGHTIWTNRELRLNHENGPGSTPVLFDDLIMFHCDGSDVQYIAALRQSNGELAWKTKRSGDLNSNPQLQKSYATPLVVSIDEQPVLISPAAYWVYGYDPATGSELWKVKYGELGFSNSARPLFHGQKSYICTGFMKSKLLAIDHSNPMSPQIAWTFNKQVSEVPSPLLIDDLLYFISDDGGIVTCVDSADGNQVWQHRIGGSHWASPLYADGKIFFFSKEGETVVIRPGRTFEELGRAQLDGRIMASPAAVDEALFLRTDRSLYRIENR